MSDPDRDQTAPSRPVTNILHGGKLAEDDVHLKREMLLARLFPAQVTRPKLGRYDLLDQLGEGGMGTVYTAYDPRLDRRVAVKVLRKAPGREGGSGHARMLREAKALARLSHTNIVTIHEVWEEQGEVHLAMEFVEGQDLSQWQQEAHPWREILAAYRQAGEGLVAAHEAGLVYRDFKPHNAIRRERDGVVKLLDFGLARIDADETAVTADRAVEPTGGDAALGEDSATHLTRPGAIMGTPAYMAPEQLEGRPADARSDQFSFCAALWEALYGRLPYSRAVIGGGIIEREEHVEPPRDHGVPQWIRRVLERGLMRSADDRYPTMRALLRELGRDPAVRRRRILGGLAAVAVMIGGGMVVAELGAQPATPCVQLDSPWSDDRRESVRAGVLGAGGASAEQTWSLLEPRLDRHAEQLGQLRRQSCESHRRGLLPSEHYALQVSCLDRREAAFTELVTLLGRADRAAVDNANEAIGRLPSPELCANTEALLAGELPPDDPEIATRVEELRTELARASAEEAVGHYDEAAARAEAVLEQAKPLRYPPLDAEALLRSGSARMMAGDSESMGRLDQALWQSLAAEQRRVAAEASTKRIFAEVELVDRTADVSEGIELARALVERPGAADWRIRWTLSNNVGVALERASEYEQALAAYRDALAWIPESTDEGAAERATTLGNMAPVQVRMGQTSEAIESARAAVEASTGLFGSEHPRLREVEGSLAYVLRTSGELREARATIDAVLSRYSPSDPPPLHTLFEAVTIYQGLGHLAEATALSARARSQLSAPGEPLGLWDVMFAVQDARLAARQGDSSAVELLTPLLDRVPPDLRIDVDLGRAEVLLMTQGRTAEAESVIEAVVDNPHMPGWARVPAQLLHGRILAAQSKWAEARVPLMALLGTEGVSLLPDERALALVALSRAERGLGNQARAIELAERALEVLDGFELHTEVVRDARAALRNARG